MPEKLETVLAVNVSPRLNKHRLVFPVAQFAAKAASKSEVPAGVDAPEGQPPAPAVAVTLAMQTVFVPE